MEEIVLIDIKKNHKIKKHNVILAIRLSSIDRPVIFIP